MPQLLPFIFTHKKTFVYKKYYKSRRFLSKEDIHFEKLKEKQTYAINLNFLAWQAKIFMIDPGYYTVVNQRNMCYTLPLTRFGQVTP